MATSCAVNSFSQVSRESKMSRFPESDRRMLGDVDIARLRCRAGRIRSCPVTGPHKFNKGKRNACQMIEESGIRRAGGTRRTREDARVSVGPLLLNLRQDGLGYTETGSPQPSDRFVEFDQAGLIG